MSDIKNMEDRLAYTLQEQKLREEVKRADRIVNSMGGSDRGYGGYGSSDIKKAAHDYQEKATKLREFSYQRESQKIKLQEALEIIGRLCERARGLENALKEIGDKSTCACWRIDAFGKPYIFKGCLVHNDEDPNVWCMTCIANASLVRLKEIKDV